MSNAFFYDLLASIADRGRSVLKIKPWPKDAENRAEQLVEACRALVAGRGEASGVALAAEILQPLPHARSFRPCGVFSRACRRVRARSRAGVSAIAKFGAGADEAAASEIHYASEPRRHELFRRLNRAPGGTAALVGMRADLLGADEPEPVARHRRSRFPASVRFVVQSRLSGVAPDRLVLAGGAARENHPL